MAKIGRPRKEDALKLKAKAVSPQPVSRAGGRIKKPKVVYDPSDNNLSKKLRREQDNNSMTKFDSDSSSPEAYHVKKIPAQKSAIRESITKKEPEEQCSICSKYEIKRDKLLIFCVDCNYRVHPQCLNINFMDFNELKAKYHCEECVLCVECKEGKDDGPMVTCKFCINTYHLDHHSPKVSEKDNLDDWTCAKCIGESDDSDENPGSKTPSLADLSIRTSSWKSLESSTSQASSISNGYFSQRRIKPTPAQSPARGTKPTPAKSPVRGTKPTPAQSPGRGIKPTPAQSSARGIKIDHVTPTPSSSRSSTHTKNFPKILPKRSDIQGWSTEKIYQFFKHDFPDESNFITINEIDGQALLLLTRDDVITKKSPWKLGRLLKFYSAILRIQHNSRSAAISW